MTTLSLLGGAVCNDLEASGYSSRYDFEFRLKQHPSKAVTLRVYEAPFPIVGGRGTTRRRYFRRYERNAINRYATRLIRARGVERIRCAELQKLDDLCKPLTKLPKFLKWVEAREKSAGTSDYATMTVEQIHNWFQAIMQWTKQNL